MAVFGIVYASESKMIRRIVGNTTNREAHSYPGEEILAVEQETMPTIFEAEALVEAATGVKPMSSKCTVLDNNIVIQIIAADATLDTLPYRTLVQAYAEIPIGSTYDPETGLFTAPGYTIPAHPGNGDHPPTDEVIVPPTVIPKP